jgi:hypothetical protein
MSENIDKVSSTQLPCIYIASAEHSNLVWISVAIGANRALEELQFTCPVTLSLVDAIPIDSWNDARTAEARVHRRLDKQRVRGKWFNIEKDIVAAVVRSMVENTTQAIRLEKESQEAKWRQAGKLDHDSGVPLSEPPRVGKPYSSLWYRAKNAWEAGWKDGQRGDA